jgi:hypothetical protein
MADETAGFQPWHQVWVPSSAILCKHIMQIVDRRRHASRALSENENVRERSYARLGGADFALRASSP